MPVSSVRLDPHYMPPNQEPVYGYADHPPAYEFHQQAAPPPQAADFPATDFDPTSYLNSIYMGLPQPMPVSTNLRLVLHVHVANTQTSNGRTCSGSSLPTARSTSSGSATIRRLSEMSQVCVLCLIDIAGYALQYVFSHFVSASLLSERAPATFVPHLPVLPLASIRVPTPT